MPQQIRVDLVRGMKPASCVADALAAEAKELGQDILDEVYEHRRCDRISI